MKGEARLLAETTSQFSSKYEDKKEELKNILANLERVTNEYGENEDYCHALQGDINELLYTKQLSQERISYRQKYINRLREYASQFSTGIDPAQSLQVERRVLAASQALDNVREIIADISEAYPHLNDILGRVDQMTDPAIDVDIVEQ